MKKHFTTAQLNKFWELVSALGLPTPEELQKELRAMKKFNRDIKKILSK